MSLGGFKETIVVPQVQTTGYEIAGADCQVLTVTLAPGQTMTSEPGSMMFMANDIRMRAHMAGCTRCCAGESCCKVVYTNEGSDPSFVALTPNFPAKVVPVSLDNIGGTFVCKKGAYFRYLYEILWHVYLSYLSHVGDVRVTIDCDCNPCTCCFGGMGFIRQKLVGKGTVFLAAGGTILEKDLTGGEKLVVNTESVVGWQPSAHLGLKLAGGCCTWCCGGEGIFNTTLDGPGLVFVQSMPFEKYQRAVAPPYQNQEQTDPVVA